MSWPDAGIAAIGSRQDLVDYLTVLARRVAANELQVENSAAGSLVDAAGRWVDSMDGFYENVMGGPVPEEPSWQMIAAIFRAALIYE
jgi:hypothetical protein